jgi:hypothetical protein
MSPAIAVYLGVAVLAWGPCAFFARRFVSGGWADRLVTGALFAAGWPMTLPLLVAAFISNRGTSPRRQPLYVVKPVAPALFAAPAAVVVER